MRAPVFKYFNGALAVAAVAALGWVLALPNKADCVASGRVVDPTERHCERPGGYQQLQEHALFHAREVVLGAAILWVGAYLLHRRRPKAEATAPPA